MGSEQGIWRHLSWLEPWHKYSEGLFWRLSLFPRHLLVGFESKPCCVESLFQSELNPKLRLGEDPSLGSWNLPWSFSYVGQPILWVLSICSCNWESPTNKLVIFSKGLV
jgi:hypothetical protein